MGLKNIVFCAKNGMFDVRHYMIAGCSVMTLTLLLISQTSLQARAINPGVQFAQKSSQTSVTQVITPQKTSSLVTAIPTDFKMNFKNAATLKQERGEKFTRLASLQTGTPVLKFSPKDRKSCSLDAARAAANGDSSGVSSCLDALLSGDHESLVTMPEKMGAFFIETMNSDIPGDQKAQIFVNSMMQMMERMTGGAE